MTTTILLAAARRAGVAFGFAGTCSTARPTTDFAGPLFAQTLQRHQSWADVKESSFHSSTRRRIQSK